MPKRAMDPPAKRRQNDCDGSSSPPLQPPQVDLSAFEREVGVPLPRDFARLASTYGISMFDELVSALAPVPGTRYRADL